MNTSVNAKREMAQLSHGHPYGQPTGLPELRRFRDAKVHVGSSLCSHPMKQYVVGRCYVHGSQEDSVAYESNDTTLLGRPVGGEEDEEVSLWSSMSSLETDDEDEPVDMELGALESRGKSAGLSQSREDEVLEDDLDDARIQAYVEVKGSLPYLGFSWGVRCPLPSSRSWVDWNSLASFYESPDQRDSEIDMTEAMSYVHKVYHKPLSRYVRTKSNGLGTLSSIADTKPSMGVTKETSLQVRLMSEQKDPAYAWRIDPIQSIRAWKKLREVVEETLVQKEPLLVVSADPMVSSMAKAMRSPFLKHQRSLKMRNAPVTLLTETWIYGRLTNFDLLRGMAMKYQVTPVHERKHASHLRYATYRRPIESLRITGKRPGLVLFLNAGRQLVAVKEAYNTGVPSAGVMSTDFPYPSHLTYPLPGNDKDIRSQMRYLGLRSNHLKSVLNP